MGAFFTWTLAALLPMAALAQETITLRDGSTFEGRMVGATERSVTFRDNSGQMHRFDVDRVQSIQFGNGYANNSYGSNYQGNSSGYPAPPPPPPDSRYGNNDQNGAAYPGNGAYTQNSSQGYPGASIALPAGTIISVRANETIDARDASRGASYSAEVDKDILGPNGSVLIPRGTEARLVVRRMNDNNLVLDLESLRVNGRIYRVDTSGIHEGRQGLGENKRTGEFVGGGAFLGTLLGAIAGGGKGAAIGALAGAGAGAGTQVLTRGDQVRVPAETVLNFRLDQTLYLNTTQ
jgi:hypothetical protein